MATLQEFFLGTRAAWSVGSVARDMVKNAKADIAAQDVEKQATIAVANAKEYLRLLNNVRNNPDADIQAAINAGVVAVGITDAGTRTDALIALATTYRDASRTTKAELDAAAQAILDVLPKALDVF